MDGAMLWLTRSGESEREKSVNISGEHKIREQH